MYFIACIAKFIEILFKIMNNALICSQLRLKLIFIVILNYFNSKFIFENQKIS